MDRSDERDRRIRELEERLSRLSEAGLRITEDLDFNTVLQGVLDSACSLTGARYGVIALHDDDGTAQDFLSSGMTPDETDRLWTLPGWPSHFEYLSAITKTLRIPDLPLVMADRQRIVQVLGNLLPDAARHSPESSVIRVSVVRDGVHVEISVSDVGRGIPAESLPHLLRKFSGAQSGEQAGDATGLGLAICKGIVEAHGGRIWAESDGPGTGACFTFTLPSVEDSRAASSLPSTSTRREGKKEERLRILAVDDDPKDLRYVRDTLAKSGYDPVVTGEPEEALLLMEAARPELVLLDLMLPGTDGIELMKHILDVADVPVIFLSVYGREELIAKAFDMGAAEYVVKPFSPTELSARIRAALRRRAAVEPSEPYLRGDLTIDYASRRVVLAGRPLHLTPTEYRVLAELSANAGRVLTHEHLLKRVWGGMGGGNIRPTRTIVSKLRRKLDDAADNPTYILTEPRVGFRMPKGRTPGGEPPATP